MVYIGSCQFSNSVQRRDVVFLSHFSVFWASLYPPLFTLGRADHFYEPPVLVRIEAVIYERFCF